MLTADQINHAFDQMVASHNNQPWEVEDQSNPDMCMDLAFGFLDLLHIPRETIRHLYAVQVWTEPLDITVDYFEYIPNTPNGTPKKGDLIVFDGMPGHISVASGNNTNVNQLESFDENWDTAHYHDKDGKPICRLVIHNYLSPKVLGWLRLKTQ